jgi:hypothetical protein
MGKILLASIAGAGLCLFSFTAGAQDRLGQDQTYHSARDTYFHGEHWRPRVFERVKQDVEHVRSTTWPSGGGDQYRLDKTVHELSDLQDKLAKHNYDEAELTDVIASLGKVASFNKMPPLERDIMNDDVARLREFREHHGDWDR